MLLLFLLFVVVLVANSQLLYIEKFRIVDLSKVLPNNNEVTLYSRICYNQIKIGCLN